MPSVSWSYSILNSFETCAFRHYKIKVEKSVVEQQGEALLHGNRVHKALELRVKDKTPIPESMPKLYEEIVQRLERSATGGKLVAEQQMALDENYRPTKWFSRGASPPAWVRVIIDAGVFKGSKAFIVDYKTGKRDPDSAQLRLSAAVTFATHPTVQEIRNAFIWLKDGTVDAETFTRADVPGIWQSFLPRVRRLEIAHEKNEWPKKPSGLCREHCPVRECEHNGKR